MFEIMEDLIDFLAEVWKEEVHYIEDLHDFYVDDTTKSYTINKHIYVYDREIYELCRNKIVRRLSLKLRHNMCIDFAIEQEENALRLNYSNNNQTHEVNFQLMYIK